MKSIGFRQCLIILSFVAFLFSCKKEGSSQDNNYYLKFKIDNNWVTWSNALGDLSQEPGSNKSGLNVSAQSSTQTEVFNIGIQVDGNLATGTYTPDNSFMAVSYTKRTGTSNFTSYTGGGIFSGPDTRYEITITSITDKIIKGNFKGSYLVNDADDTDTLAITEGEFVVPRIR